MKEQINKQLVQLERELSRLKKVTNYINDTKKTSHEIISELKEVHKSYSVCTEEIFNLYRVSIDKLKLQIKEGVVSLEATGSAIDKSNKILSGSLASELKDIKNNHASHMKKIFELYKLSLTELHQKIKEGTASFKITGSKIDQTNREKLTETKNLIEATGNLINKMEVIDFPARLNTIEEKISKNIDNISHRFDRQDEQNKTIRILLFTLLTLVGISGIGIVIIYL